MILIRVTSQKVSRGSGEVYRDDILLIPPKRQRIDLQRRSSESYILDYYKDWVSRPNVYNMKECASSERK